MTDEPTKGAFPLRAPCGCHYRLQDEYDTRDGGPFKVVIVDPATWNRCTLHAAYPHYQFAASEIARMPKASA